MTQENGIIENYTLQEPIAIADIKENKNGMRKIIYLPGTQKVKEIQGAFSKQLIFDEQDAVSALSSVRNIMNISDLSFCCDLIEEREGSVVFWLTQMYKDLPVVDHGFRVGAGNDGQPLFVSGSFRNNIEISTKPIYDAETCQNTISLSGDDEMASIQLVVYVHSDVDYLSWEFKIKSNDPLKNKNIYCDATSGEVLAVIYDAVA